MVTGTGLIWYLLIMIDIVIGCSLIIVGFLIYTGKEEEEKEGKG
jgi:hypothetical protein